MALAHALPRPASSGLLPAPGPSTRRATGFEPNATLLERGALTPTILRLRIRADDGVPDFRAGQYFAIGLHVDGRFVQRPYSTASTPGSTASTPGALLDLEFLVRLVRDGSLTPSLWQLRPGDRVRLGPPKGLFTLDPGDPRRHLFLSTGTGIAPLMSMLGSLLGQPEASAAGCDRAGPPVVVHGVATVPELAERDHLERLDRDGAIVYMPAISRPADPASAGWRGSSGRLDTLVRQIAERASLTPATTVAYLCGNPAMVEAVGAQLSALGLPADAIRAEQYWTRVDGRSAADLPPGS
jgi:ferredoxin--NADP+ reductase